MERAHCNVGCGLGDKLHASLTPRHVAGVELYESNNYNSLVGDNPTSPRYQTLTDSYLYEVAQYHLLEPPTGNGTWTGTSQFSLADFTQALQRRRDQILQATDCNVGPFSTTLGLAVTDANRVLLPDDHCYRHAPGTLCSGNRRSGYTVPLRWSGVRIFHERLRADGWATAGVGCAGLAATGSDIRCAGESTEPAGLPGDHFWAGDCTAYRLSAP